ncbi:SDR family NAD(P)-dependent oxidoreductase [Kineococcus aurantiacus]|uniref:NAD(P)-dependent dehydrogenase (Short-subunit alcohol dehydrogenase family) n=1 Tax=Kineococcus aurantiacus TaxID=37633 RepID=A0A7Y9DLX3_9ACTN|nr:NAD(P)-dependent dehydrogenase (short-subunit alcohol dehydrogenase family) [Kineococcus aurantiacus]
MTWNPTTLPDRDGSTFVVTGATAGIGYFAAEQLATTGAHVVLASRSAARLDRAATSVRRHVPGARVSTVVLDLASLTSVRRAAGELTALGPLDGLLLNGGSMSTARETRTEDGLPEMLGTHVVANVALTAALLPALEGGRVVHTTTGFVRRARMRVDDVTTPHRGFFRTYTFAKTVTEVYAHELDRRLRAAGSPTASVLTFPGVGVDARTPAREGVFDPRTQTRRNPFTPWAQGKDAAAWSGVRALLDPAVRGGELLGPANGRRGLPERAEPNAHTAHPGADRAARVWDQLHELAATAAAGPVRPAARR